MKHMWLKFEGFEPEQLHEVNTRVWARMPSHVLYEGTAGESAQIHGAPPLRSTPSTRFSHAEGSQVRDM